MIRITIDIEEYGDELATKEAVAMALERFGKVRVVQIYTGREERRDGRNQTQRTGAPGQLPLAAPGAYGTGG